MEEIDFSSSDLNILLIEDHPGDVMLFQHACEGFNFSIDDASSVYKAKSKLHKKDYDIIFTDLNTADSMGASAVKDIKAVYPDASIIVLTGLGTSLTREECLKAGASDFLLKSELSPEKLIETIEAAGFKGSKI